MSNWVIRWGNYALSELAHTKVLLSFMSMAFIFLISIFVLAPIPLYPANNSWKSAGGHQRPLNHNLLPQ
jgi:hypothetical protein